VAVVTIKDLIAGGIAGAACLAVSLNGQPDERVQSVAWSVSESALRVETMTGTTWIDPEIAVYSPSRCRVEVLGQAVEPERIFRDRFEGVRSGTIRQ